MSIDDLAGVLAKDCSLTMSSVKATTKFELFTQAKQRYFYAVIQLKPKMKEMSLESLIEISEENGTPIKIIDPDQIPENNVSITEAARREIHRRAFQGFNIAPYRKEKLDGSRLGFLRKPKF